MSTSGMNGIPGANAMGDTLDFVKNLWGSMKIPGMAMPSVSPEEIDKQIADLKAVEAWLQVNMNMLRSSIQALEVQSATLTALRSMSESFTQAASGQAGKSAADGAPAFESPFASSFTSPFASAAAGQQAETEAPSAVPDPANMAAQFGNAAAWWNAMQDQFQQVVSRAVTPPKKPARKTGAAKKKPAAAGKTAADSAPRRRRTSGE